MTDLKVTHYKVGKDDEPHLNYLSMVASAFDVIPLSLEAQQHVMGKMEFAGHELVLVKGKAMEEVSAFLMEVCGGVADDIHGLSAEQMLWYISTLERHDPLFPKWKHPLEDYGKQLTFQQLISYKRLAIRNNSEGNGWTTGWSGNVFFMAIKYKSGGGITIGIEPCGYAHS